MKKLTLTGMVFVLGGCSLIPEYQRPEAPTPGQYPRAVCMRWHRPAR